MTPGSPWKALPGPLKTIEESALRCQEITKNLLYFSRSGSSGKLMSLDVNECIENVFTLISRNLELEGIRLSKELSSDIPVIKANSSQIQQVLLSLISNSQWAMCNSREKSLSIKSEFDRQDKKLRLLLG